MVYRDLPHCSTSTSPVYHSNMFSITCSKDTPGGIERLSVCDVSSWTYSERNRSDSNEIAFETSLRDRDGDQESSNDTDSNKQVKALQTKVAERWDRTVQILQQNAELWGNSAYFFGISEFHSTAELSYRALNDSSQELHLYQAPFHKINLACFEEESIRSAKCRNPSILEANCRRSLLGSLHPGYEKLDPKEHNRIWKRHVRNIEQGNTLRSLCKDNAGLLLTVAPSLSAKDLNFVSKELGRGLSVLDLLGQETLTESKKFGILESRLLRSQPT
ncbi:hypothetical protein CC78DRAFT_257357 [Lojkania enalia]|uniref:Uncharacterized protein n=1 Tax=Lojkania enalia TaxID=147567 RepID=A0A9P4K912_9PLEO|nr:hypothetical protein CC78DRAFT_257357 [Didymosphaeria enalia]